MEELLYLETEKCFSYGVRRNEKFNTLPMSLMLDEAKKKNWKKLFQNAKENYPNLCPKFSTEKTKTRST